MKRRAKRLDSASPSSSGASASASGGDKIALEQQVAMQGRAKPLDSAPPSSSGASASQGDKIALEQQVAMQGRAKPLDLAPPSSSGASATQGNKIGPGKAASANRAADGDKDAFWVALAAAGDDIAFRKAVAREVRDRKRGDGLGWK